MTVLLDTSAIIGWLERTDSSVPALLAGSDTALYHPVTLGELHAGVERARGRSERDMRRTTVQFTLQRLEAVVEHVLATEDRKLFDVVTSDEFADVIAHRGWACPDCRLVESTPVLRHD